MLGEPPAGLRKPPGMLPLGRTCRACGHLFDSEDAQFCPFDGEPLAPTEEARPADPLVGDVIDGRYLVERVLGAGGMGTVYQVMHGPLAKRFAMKVLRPDLAREKDLAERFLREARAAAAIDHEHVVRITDFGALPDKVPFFVMELLAGSTLSKLVRDEGALAPARARTIAEQAAAGLAQAHSLGIIHRDLKSDNLYVLPGDQVKVLDFGVAQVAGAARITKTGIVFGTPHYMSPEQATGGTLGPPSDVYALGVILYEALTGRVPFEADTYMGVLTKHLHVAPVPPSQVHPRAGELPALEAIVLRCLAKRPEDRYASMQELIEHLRRADVGVELHDIVRGPRAALPASSAGEEPTESLRGSGTAPPPSDRRGAGRRLVLWGGAALGLVFAVAVGVAAGRPRAGPTLPTTSVAEPAARVPESASIVPVPAVASPDPSVAGEDATAAPSRAVPSASGPAVRSSGRPGKKPTAGGKSSAAGSLSGEIVNPWDHR